MTSPSPALFDQQVVIRRKTESRQTTTGATLRTFVEADDGVPARVRVLSGPELIALGLPQQTRRARVQFLNDPTPALKPGDRIVYTNRMGERRQVMVELTGGGLRTPVMAEGSEGPEA